jgi:hypothetical protein
MSEEFQEENIIGEFTNEEQEGLRWKWGKIKNVFKNINLGSIRRIQEDIRRRIEKAARDLERTLRDKINNFINRVKQLIERSRQL